MNTNWKKTMAGWGEGYIMLWGLHTFSVKNYDNSIQLYLRHQQLY